MHRPIDQSQGEVKQLEPGQPIERQIAGGQTHDYQIRLAVGQFMRVVVEPKGIDLSVSLTAPDGSWPLLERHLLTNFCTRQFKISAT